MNRRKFLAVAATAPTLSGANVPRRASLKSYPAPQGKRIDLAAYKGKVVAVEFLLTTCPACQQCSRLLQKMYTEFGPKGFQPIGLATNPGANVLVPDYIRRQGLTFPVGWCRRDEVLEFLQLSVMARLLFPQLAFIGRKAMVRAQHTGGDAFFADEENNMRKLIGSLVTERV